jgi:hypothetical protein
MAFFYRLNDSLQPSFDSLASIGSRFYTNVNDVCSGLAQKFVEETSGITFCLPFHNCVRRRQRHEYYEYEPYEQETESFQSSAAIHSTARSVWSSDNLEFSSVDPSDKAKDKELVKEEKKKSRKSKSRSRSRGRSRSKSRGRTEKAVKNEEKNKMKKSEKEREERKTAVEGDEKSEQEKSSNSDENPINEDAKMSVHSVGSKSRSYRVRDEDQSSEEETKNGGIENQ